MHSFSSFPQQILVIQTHLVETRKRKQHLLAVIGDIVRCHDKFLLHLIEMYLSFSFEDLSTPCSIEADVLTLTTKQIRFPTVNYIRKYQLLPWDSSGSIESVSLRWQNLEHGEEWGNISFPECQPPLPLSLIQTFLWKDILIVECIMGVMVDANYYEQTQVLCFFDLKKQCIVHKIVAKNDCCYSVELRSQGAIIWSPWKSVTLHENHLWFLGCGPRGYCEVCGDRALRCLRLHNNSSLVSFSYADLTLWRLPFLCNTQPGIKRLLNGHVWLLRRKPGCSWLSWLFLWKLPCMEGDPCPQEDQEVEASFLELELPGVTGRLWVDGCYLYRSIDYSEKGECYSLLSGKKVSDFLDVEVCYSRGVDVCHGRWLFRFRQELRMVQQK